MDIISIVIILAVFVALLFALYRLGSKHVKFSRRVFIALALGIVFGAAIQLLFAPDSTITLTAIDWINIVGNGYVRFLQMLIMPLIFVSIVGAYTRIEETKNLGKISGSVLGTLLGTTAIAALIGWASVILFNLDGAQFTQGTAETARIEALTTQQTQVADLTIPGQVLSFIWPVCAARVRLPSWSFPLLSESLIWASRKNNPTMPLYSRKDCKSSNRSSCASLLWSFV